MSRIPPVPEDQLSDYFRDLVAKDEAAGRDSALNAVMAHHADFFEDYFSFFYPAHERGVLDTRVKEIARLEIARLNNCLTCLNARYASATREGLDEERIAQLDLPVAERELDPREDSRSSSPTAWPTTTSGSIRISSTDSPPSSRPPRSSSWG